jgi:hypothetical protein
MAFAQGITVIRVPALGVSDFLHEIIFYPQVRGGSLRYSICPPVLLWARYIRATARSAECISFLHPLLQYTKVTSQAYETFVYISSLFIGGIKLTPCR